MYKRNIFKLCSHIYLFFQIKLPPMRTLFSILPFFFFSSIILAQPEIELDFYAGGFSSPVDIVHAGDDRLFIVERSGRIKIIDETGSTLPTPFLDIDSKVAASGGQSERGLLGLDFHPEYANNGYFYVRYTNNSGNSILARYSVCLLYTSPSPRDATLSRMPSSA